jgi:hypothetical protein
MLNNNSQALEVLRESTVLAAQYAGATSPVSVQNRLFLADAQLTAGNLEAAHTTVSGVLESTSRQYGPTHPLSLRARLGYARWSLASGHEIDLTDIIASLRAAGPAAKPALAEALELSSRARSAQHGKSD